MSEYKVRIYNQLPEPEPPRPRKSAFGRVVGWLLGWTIVVGGLGMAAGAWAWLTFTAPGPLGEQKTVDVQKGLSRTQIASLLKQQGVISDPLVYSVAAGANAVRGRFIKPGEYAFRPGDSMQDVMATMLSGRVVTYKVTLPEGWTSEMALARLQENGILTGDAGPIPPEGSLVADTMVFARGTTRQQLIEEMQKAQSRILDDVWQRRPADFILKSKEELLTLASIVEKETGKAEERPLVAGVFLNRLKKGMPLQSDPTIIYGLVGGKGKLDRPLTRSDIASATLYNTYVIPALPPGPIASPGRASMEAVINPATTEYLYFVADGTGGHAFAATLPEHNANVAKWRQIENSSEPAPAAETKQDADGLLSAVPLEEPPAAPVTAPVAESPPAEVPEVPEEQVAAAEPPIVEDGPVLDLKPGSVIRVGEKLIPVPAERALKP